MIRTAVLSPCGRYRYLLGRIWNEFAVATNPRTVLWAMLNPSTATHEVDDATVRRCIAFSKEWGYDGLEVVNLFALRSKDPYLLRKASAPIGPENDRRIREVAARAHLIVAAWGGQTALQTGRWVDVLAMLREHGDVYCLGKTASTAHPRHPLYVRSSQPLELLAEKLQEVA